MALGGTIIAYGAYYFIKKIAPEWTAILIAGWASVVLASLACALELGFSGTIPMEAVVPAMLKVHVVIGVAEALITLALINLFRSLTAEESS